MGTGARHERKLRAKRFLASRYGVASRGELLDLSLSPDEIRYMLESGDLEVIHRGVYRATTAPQSWQQLALAATLRAPGQTWLSHRSAGFAWNLDGVELNVPIEVRTTAALRSSRDVRAYRTDSVMPCDRRVVRQLPTIAVERTLLDLASIESDLAEDALDDALRRRLTTCDRIRWRLDRLGRQGRAGSAVLCRLLDERPEGKPRFGSGFERRLFAALKKEPLPLPERQVVIRDGGRFIAQVDFAYPHHRIIIEAQSYRWHVGRKNWIRDVDRFNDLAALGWRIIQVRWDELTTRPDAVANRVRKALGIEVLTFRGI